MHPLNRTLLIVSPLVVGLTLLSGATATAGTAEVPHGVTPLTIDPNPAAPGSTVAVTGAHCPEGDWAGTFQVHVWVADESPNFEEAIAFPPGSTGWSDDVPADAQVVTPSADGSWQADVVLPTEMPPADPPDAPPTVWVRALCRTDDPLGGAVTYDSIVVLETTTPSTPSTTPPPVADPQSEPPTFTG